MTATTPRRVILICAGLGGLTALSVVAALMLGAVEVPFRTVWSLLTGGDTPEVERTILLNLRLPRIILAGAAGMALAQCGAVFQSVLRNPLAEPFILEISSGAALGAVIAIVAGFSGYLTVSLAAFLGAILSVAVILGFARRGKRVGTNTLLLCGVVLNAFFVSIIMFFISTTTDQTLHSILFWLYGDLSSARYGQAAVILPVSVGGGVVLLAYARHLNLFTAGEDAALYLGLEVERTKYALLLISSLLTGVVVSVSGIIGFVGLIVPHLIRMAFGSDHRLLLPASAFFGAFFLIAADTLSRTLIAPAELPVGVITAFLGAPFFIVLLSRRRSGWSGS